MKKLNKSFSSAKMTVESMEEACVCIDCNCSCSICTTYTNNVAIIENHPGSSVSNANAMGNYQ